MEGIKKGILKGFLELDEKLRKIPEVASGEDKSGTTAVCALISQKYLIIANCGDSRSLVCTAGKPVLATQVSPKRHNSDLRDPQLYLKFELCPGYGGEQS